MFRSDSTSNLGFRALRRTLHGDLIKLANGRYLGWVGCVWTELNWAQDADAPQIERVSVEQVDGIVAAKDGDAFAAERRIRDFRQNVADEFRVRDETHALKERTKNEGRRGIPSDGVEWCGKREGTEMSKSRNKSQRGGCVFPPCLAGQCKTCRLTIDAQFCLVCA